MAIEAFTPTRRGLLGAIMAAPIAAVPFPASAMLANEFSEAVAAFHAVHAEHRRICHLEPSPRSDEYGKWRDQEKEAMRQANAAFEKLMALPASSNSDLAKKIEVTMEWFGDCDEALDPILADVRRLGAH